MLFGLLAPKVAFQSFDYAHPNESYYRNGVVYSKLDIYNLYFSLQYKQILLNK